MEAVVPAPPLPYNVRVQVKNEFAHVRVKGHHTFGNLITKTCRVKGWGDHNQYYWTSDNVRLYEYDNGWRVQMWWYGLPPFGHVKIITGQPKMPDMF